MNAKPVLKIASCLIALFLMGSMCGYAVSGRIGGKGASFPHLTQWAERWLEQRMEQDFAAIQATPEQQEKLRPLYDHLLNDFKVIQHEAAQKVTESFKNHNRELRDQLTAEQRDAMQKLNQERMGRGRKINHESTTQP